MALRLFDVVAWDVALALLLSIFCASASGRSVYPAPEWLIMGGFDSAWPNRGAPNMYMDLSLKHTIRYHCHQSVSPVVLYQSMLHSDYASNPYTCKK